MKLINNKSIIGIATIAMAAFALSSCDAPTYSSSDDEDNIAKTSFTTYDDVTVNSVDATLGDSYMRGFDASMISAIEETGALFYDEDNTQKDPLAILKEHGVNWIRLRIWNNPDVDSSDIPAGDNNLIRTVAVAKRAKALGLNVLLDFHYSDSWADPSKQYLPSAWSELTTVDGIADAVYSYTYDVLNTLKKADATPDMVQIGNEIDTGLFTSACYSTDLQGDIEDHADNLATYLKAASDAVRLACSDAAVMIHISRGGASIVTTWLSTSCTIDGVTTTLGAGIDYDVVGLSYYPTDSTHGTLTGLKSNISTIKSTYNKRVVIAEISYGWTDGYGDDTSNTFASTNDTYYSSGFNAYTNLTTGGSESDFVVSYDTSKSASYIAGTPQNQANVVRAVIEASADAGAEGIFYWGGD